MQIQEFDNGGVNAWLFLKGQEYTNAIILVLEIYTINHHEQFFGERRYMS